MNTAGMNMLVQIPVSSDFMLGCILALGRVEWEALIHWCVLTPGLDLSLSLVSLVGEHNDFSRGGRGSCIWTGKTLLFGRIRFFWKYF